MPALGGDSGEDHPSTEGAGLGHAGGYLRNCHEKWARSLCLTVPTLGVTACNAEGGKDTLLGSLCLQLDGISGIWGRVMVVVPGA